MYPPIDLTDKRFGRLIALGIVAKTIKWRQSIWKCLCDCGNITLVSGGNLRNGHTRSCGCLSSETTTRLNKENSRGRKPRNLIGRRFGYLIVIKLAPYKPGKRVIWECRCDCGKLTRVCAGDLTLNHTRSCGCLLHGKRERAAHWQGGRSNLGKNYMFIFQPEHPQANGSGYVREHRLVMERKLGRYLYPSEEIHHIDGDTFNNDPCNLMIMGKRQHTVWHKRLNEIAIYD